jgi:hypothetical protein
MPTSLGLCPWLFDLDRFVNSNSRWNFGSWSSGRLFRDPRLGLLGKDDERRNEDGSMRVGDARDERWMAPTLVG